jgi:cytidine deaminase
MAKEQKHRGITRIDSHDTHGWFVRAYKAGKTTSKLFSDAIYGGKNKALKEAQDFRESLVKRLTEAVGEGETVRPSKAVSKKVDLVTAALDAMKNAVAPYSKFNVGAAIKTASGEVYSGHNIESPSFSLTICAERVALYKALSEGAREFRAIAIASNSDEFCAPCGACRQALSDFAANIDVILVNKKGDTKKYKLEKLLPFAFGDSNLGASKKDK